MGATLSTHGDVGEPGAGRWAFAGATLVGRPVLCAAGVFHPEMWAGAGAGIRRVAGELVEVYGSDGAGDCPRGGFAAADRGAEGERVVHRRWEPSARGAAPRGLPIVLGPGLVKFRE